MTPDFPALLASARRCNAAYLEKADDARTAFQALGETFIGQFQNDDHQAVLCSVAPGHFRLTISGTRFSDGELHDILDDIDDTPLAIGNGNLVGQGAIRGLGQMWAWTLDLVGSDGVFDVEGHSLGGWRTCYTPEFLPIARIGSLTPIESPKAANQTYYEEHRLIFETRVTSIVNERDLWCGYPFIGPFHKPPQPFVWLTGGGFRMVTEAQWPGGRRVGDHGISSSVIPNLVALTTRPPAPELMLKVAA